jgi:ArsR family transcriptional regulator
MNYKKERFDLLANILKATAHPVRLHILEELKTRKLCVKEFATELDLDISTISKHLSLMKKNGLVVDYREANCVYYKIRCECVVRLMEAAQDMLRSNIERTNKIMG